MKKWGVVLVILALLLGGAAAAWYFVLADEVLPLAVLDPAPEDPVFVIREPQSSFWLDDAAQQPIWEQLSATGLVRKYSSLQSALQDALSGSDSLPVNLQRGWTSAYITGAGKFDLLYTTRWDKKALPENLPSEIFEGIDIRSADNIELFVERGVLVASSSRILLEDAIRSIGNGKSLAADATFAASSEGKHPDDPTLFVNSNVLSEYLGMFVSPELAEDASRLEDVMGWLSLDLRVYEESVFFNGFAWADEGDLLARFPVPDTASTSIETALPANTRLMWRTSGGPLSLFRSGRESDSWQNWLTGESALAMVEALSSDPAAHLLMVLKIKDRDAASAALSSIAEQDKSWQDIPVWKLSSSSRQISARFGESLRQFDDAYLIVAGDFLIAAPSRGTMERAAEAWQSRQGLAFSPDYISFKSKLSSGANASLYLDPTGFSELINTVILDRYAEDFGVGLSELSQLRPLHFQFDHYRGKFLTSGFLHYGTAEQAAPAAGNLWTLALDTVLAREPFLVSNHDSEEMEVLVQDAANQLYLVAKDGQLLWKVQLDGPIVGDVHQIDYYKNRKLQYLFSTTNSIHLVDRKGRPVADYPIQFSAGASAGVACIDYDGKRDYRIFLGAENGNLYGYYKTGKPLPGWSPLRSNGVLTHPVEHFAYAGKDYLALATQDGKLQLLNRRGEPRREAINLGSPLLTPIRFSESDGLVMEACDTLGRLLRIKLDGTYNSLQLPRISDHSLLATAQLSDKSLAYVSVNPELGSSVVELRKSDGSRVWNSRLPGGTDFLYVSEATDPLIAVSSRSAAEWNVFSSGGSLLPGFPMPGGGPIIIAPLTGNDDQVMIGGKSNLLIARKLR